jgi:hypothetical protein
MTTEPAPTEPEADGPQRPKLGPRRWALVGGGALVLIAAIAWGIAGNEPAPGAAPEAPKGPAAAQLAPLEVTVRSPTEEPLEGAHVRVLSGDDSRADNVTDHQGMARLTVTLGTLLVEVSREGYARTLARAEASAPAKLSVTVTLEPERVLEGTVLDDQGTPLGDTHVHVQSLEMAEMTGWDAVSDEAGHFRIAGLPRHELALDVSRAGHEAHERAISSGYDEALTVVMPRQGELLVTVRDAAGLVVKDAELLLTGTGLWPAAAARADALGQHLFTALGSGQYRARAVHGALVALPSQPVEVVPGARASVEISLVQGARACGRVLDESGEKPIAGATVAVHDLTPGLPARTVTTGANGGFEAVGLWAGSARIEVSREGYAPLSFDSKVPHAACADLHMRGAASISGTVLDERGQPVAGAFLSVATGDGLPANVSSVDRGDVAPVGELGVTRGPVPRIPIVAPTSFVMGTLAAETDAQGAFRITGLTPSPIVLSVARAGYAPSTLEISDLKPHESRAGVHMVLNAAGRIEGRVSDARGHGLGGVYLSARSREGVEQSAFSDADGSFVIPDMLGDVTVEATPSGYASTSCNVTVQAHATARCNLPLDSALFELAVRVEDERGQALSGALVTARAAGSERAVTQLTRDDGSAVLRELPEPPFLVDVTLAGYLRVHKQRVDRAGKELRIALERASRIMGVVLDTLGHPVHGAFVSTDEGDATADSDRDGNFVLEGVAPGALVLWARHKNAGEGESAEVRARPGDTLEAVRIVLDGRYVPSSDDDTKHAAPAVDSARAAKETPASAPAEPTITSPGTPTKAQALGLEQRGAKVLINAVGGGTAGEKAGMRAGDILLSVDGETVFSAAQARGMLRDPPNTSAAIRVSRGGRTLSLRFKRAAL